MGTTMASLAQYQALTEYMPCVTSRRSRTRSRSHTVTAVYLRGVRGEM